MVVCKPDMSYETLWGKNLRQNTSLKEKSLTGVQARRDSQA